MSEEKKAMNKKTKVVIGAVVLCILIGSGYSWFYMVKKEANIVFEKAEAQHQPYLKKWQLATQIKSKRKINGNNGNEVNFIGVGADLLQFTGDQRSDINIVTMAGAGQVTRSVIVVCFIVDEQIYQDMVKYLKVKE